VTSLAHRGLWAEADERNTLAAFSDAFAHGWGVELDVRDLDGALVISHDPPTAGALTFRSVVDAFLAAGAPGRLAVNVKADGLEGLIADTLGDVDPASWFAFDMSVPDTLRYASAGLPYFSRHSEVEPEPALYDRSCGVWLDDFYGGFVTEARIASHLAAGKQVAVVSPELHGRDHVAAWDEWRRWSVWGSPDVHLCTDHPTQAEEAFA
jgi:glycerophosphoryl diester phosphodiesterase